MTKKHNKTLSLSTDDGNDDYDEDVEGDDNAENDIAVCVTIVSEVWAASCHHSVTNKQYALGQQ